MRRKTLQNAISAKFPQYSKELVAEAILTVTDDEKVRGERLSTADFAKLSNFLADK
jgi:16S rRNA A1518/A1519 N6-dimethyltransferase RsmA/KsgA/DIM1 with predicted DNA glycosylase/AP lyase activity